MKSNATVINEIKSIYGKVLGEIFENANGFGFYHTQTQVEEINFPNRSDAENAWQDHHDDWFENLPRSVKGY
jgi:hypothetical protein